MFNIQDNGYFCPERDKYKRRVAATLAVNPRSNRSVTPKMPQSPIARWSKLPPELIRMVLDAADEQDIYALLCVNKLWNHTCLDYIAKLGWDDPKLYFFVDRAKKNERQDILDGFSKLLKKTKPQELNVRVETVYDFQQTLQTLGVIVLSNIDNNYVEYMDLIVHPYVTNLWANPPLLFSSLNRRCARDFIPQTFKFEYWQTLEDYFFEVGVQNDHEEFRRCASLLRSATQRLSESYDEVVDLHLGGVAAAMYEYYQSIELDKVLLQIILTSRHILYEDLCFAIRHTSNLTRLCLLIDHLPVTVPRVHILIPLTEWVNPVLYEDVRSIILDNKCDRSIRAAFKYGYILPSSAKPHILKIVRRVLNKHR